MKGKIPRRFSGKRLFSGGKMLLCFFQPLVHSPAVPPEKHRRREADDFGNGDNRKKKNRAGGHKKTHENGGTGGDDQKNRRERKERPPVYPPRRQEERGFGAGADQRARERTFERGYRPGIPENQIEQAGDGHADNAGNENRHDTERKRLFHARPSPKNS